MDAREHSEVVPFLRSREGDARRARREGNLETIEDGFEDAEGEGGGHLASAEGAYPLLSRLRGIAGGDARGEFEGREEVRDADGEAVGLVLRLLGDPEERAREPRGGGGEGRLRAAEEAPGRAGEVRGGRGRRRGRGREGTREAVDVGDVRGGRGDATAGPIAPPPELGRGVHDVARGVSVGANRAYRRARGVRAARRRRRDRRPRGERRGGAHGALDDARVTTRNRQHAIHTCATVGFFGTRLSAFVNRD